jgi:hypothetical protein
MDQKIVVDVNSSTTTQSSFNGITIGNSNTTANNGCAIAFSQSSSNGNSFSRIGVINKDRTASSEDQDMFFGTIGAGAYAERMRIDSSGKVGIGTASPQEQIHSYAGGSNALRVSGGANNNKKVEIGYDNTNGPYIKAGSSGETGLQFYVDNTSLAATIDNTGKVGIGTSPLAKLHTYGADALMRLDDTNGGVSFFGHDSTGAYWRTFTTDTHRFLRASGTESMRITSAGGVAIGTSSPISGVMLDVRPTSTTRIMNTRSFDTSFQYHHAFENNSGTLVGSIGVSTTATTYAVSSDYRLKENVTATWDATTRLKQLNPVRFNFIADADTTVDGFLAHEVQDIVPEAITGTKDAVDDDGNPVYQGIDQSKLVPLLVKTIQELEARITALEA